VKRKDMEFHLKYDCVQRLIDCKFCGEKIRYAIEIGIS
jgi:hypothetical protein